MFNVRNNQNPAGYSEYQTVYTSDGDALLVPTQRARDQRTLDWMTDAGLKAQIEQCKNELRYVEVQEDASYVAKLNHTIQAYTAELIRRSEVKVESSINPAPTPSTGRRPV